MIRPPNWANGRFLEGTYPLFAGGMAGFFAFLVLRRCSFHDSDSFQHVLEAAVTFSSIVVGFLGALLAILMSIRDSEIVGFMYKHVDKAVLRGYFKSAILAGIATVVFSSALYILPSGLMGDLASICWASVVGYFILASYRIIDILLEVIFKEPEATEHAPPGNRMSPEEASRLEDQFKATGSG